MKERELLAVEEIEESKDSGTNAEVHKTAMKAELRRQRLKELEEEADDPEIAEFMELIPKIKPKTRAECRNRQRPCVFVSCKYNLYLDVNPNTGTIKLNFPDKEPWELEETCALDVAERGGLTLEEIGELMNLTRERIRQLEGLILDKIKMDENSRCLLDIELEDKI